MAEISNFVTPTTVVGVDNINSAEKLNGNRYQGGSQRSASDHPFIKGYFYVFFKFPEGLFKDESDKKMGETYLMASAEDYTPPGDRQINVQDIQGQGGVDASFITGQTISREFSIQYKDYWGAPIFRVHKVLTSFIDPYLGVNTKVDSKFAASEYKGTCMVVQTKPVARKDGQWNKEDIIKVSLFDGVQCLTDFNSIYSANITDNSFVKPVAQYKFDGYPLDETDESTMTKAMDSMNAQALFEPTAALYEALSGKTGI
jgi:hypothetical protein